MPLPFITAAEASICLASASAAAARFCLALAASAAGVADLAQPHRKLVGLLLQGRELPVHDLGSTRLRRRRRLRGRVAAELPAELFEVRLRGPRRDDRVVVDLLEPRGFVLKLGDLPAGGR